MFIADEGTVYSVDQVVPYVNSTCVIIVDSGYEGELEHMMYCVNSFDKFEEGKSWLFTYSTLRQCDTKAGSPCTHLCVGFSTCTDWMSF